MRNGADAVGQRRVVWNFVVQLQIVGKLFLGRGSRAGMDAILITVVRKRRLSQDFGRRIRGGVGYPVV